MDDHLFTPEGEYITSIDYVFHYARSFRKEGMYLWSTGKWYIWGMNINAFNWMEIQIEDVPDNAKTALLIVLD